MSGETSFVLEACSSTLSQAQEIHLLPFSLGSSSNPYTSTTAPISSYFQPRPCPANHPSIPENTPIAAFRGRQLVGQSIEVPKGYRGVILRSGKRPDRGGIEIRQSTSHDEDELVGAGRGKVKKGKWPLTPATSVASTSTSVSTATGSVASGSVVGDEEFGGVRRSPRKSAGGRARGAGQVALSKPKRQLGTRSLRKRLRLDSDSEEETQPNTPRVDEDDDEDVKMVRSPSKKFRKGIGGLRSRTPAKAENKLPEIVIQAPTPKKKRPHGDHETDDVYGGIIEEEENQSSWNGVKEEINEPILPSPATEEEPAPFVDEVKPLPETEAKTEQLPSIPEKGTQMKGDVTKTSIGDVTMQEDDEEEGVDLMSQGNIRRLVPSASFTKITLWTADTPLQGFRQNELDTKYQNGEQAEVEKDIEDEGLELKSGWWRVGGAGQGGDEFVRGLGEWLGLTEMLNEPVYLKDPTFAKDLAESDDDE